MTGFDIALRPDHEPESQERRARRLFDEMARNIGREAVNHLKTMYPEIISDRGRRSKSWETSLTNHIRNDINWRMRPLLMAMIAMHREWGEETTDGAALAEGGERSPQAEEQG